MGIWEGERITDFGAESHHGFCWRGGAGGALLRGGEGWWVAGAGRGSCTGGRSVETALPI
jgi:hypothetical protein